MAALNMTLITRAELNSVLVPETGRKALVLDGQVLEFGDTGLRDLTGLLKPSATLGGKVLVKRVGHVITWYVSALQVSASTTSNWPLIEAAGGHVLNLFAPDQNIYTTVMTSATDTGRLYLNGLGGLDLHHGEPNASYTAVISFATSRPWPTVLPGVANGQPVGI